MSHKNLADLPDDELRARVRMNLRAARLNLIRAAESIALAESTAEIDGSEKSTAVDQTLDTAAMHINTVTEAVRHATASWVTLRTRK